MNLTNLICPVCGAHDKLNQKQKDGLTVWHCSYCNGEFLSNSLEYEYEKLECCIKQGLGMVVNEIILQEKTEQYYNLRSMLWEKLHAKYIDSASIVQICRDIKKLAPQDFVAEFFDLANSGLDEQIVDFIQDMDIVKNSIFMSWILDFLIASLKESYIVPVALLLERVASVLSPEQRQKYCTAFEIEVNKIQEGMYEPSLERDVFLAYSSKDMKSVVKILNYIEENGLTCFAAFRNLQHGRGAVANYEKYLYEAIDNCKIFLFVSSVNSRSYSCDAFKKEIAYVKASEMNKFPAYRNYEQIPEQYKKLRIEYRLDNKPTPLVDNTLKKFFSGLTYVEDFEQLVVRLAEYMEIANNCFEVSDSFSAPTNVTTIKENQSNENLPSDGKNNSSREIVDNITFNGSYTDTVVDGYRSSFKKQTFENGDVYEGEVQGGKWHGKGKYVWANGDVYEGEWKDGNRHGKGKYTFVNGDVYEGEYKDGKWHGKGVYTYANGDVYDGEWLNDKYHGKGKYTYASGDVYEGEYKEGKCHGKGVYTYANGEVYKGEYKEGKRNGKGKYVWADGAVYEGDWVNGNRHGKGVYTYANGDVYEGEYKEGKCHGKGKYFFVGGGVYEGEYKDNQCYGKGKMTFADGRVYEGEFKEGKCHGKGKYTYANGDVYDGDWLNDKRHGKGKYVWTNGDVYDGDWLNDKRNGKGKMTFADGAVYEGEVQGGKWHGKGKFVWADGDVYEGEYKEGKYHGKGKYTFADGGVYEGDWVNGNRHGKGKMTYANGAVYEGEWKNDKRNG